MKAIKYQNQLWCSPDEPKTVTTGDDLPVDVDVEIQRLKETIALRDMQIKDMHETKKQPF